MYKCCVVIFALFIAAAAAGPLNETEPLKSCKFRRVSGVAYQCFTYIQRGFVLRPIRKPCNSEVSSGTSLITFCVDQEFSESLEYICTDGVWNSEPTCSPSPSFTPDPKAVEAFDNQEDSKQCTLPPHPVHGSYTVLGNINAVPGEVLPTVSLNYTCLDGYILNTSLSQVFCDNGTWSHKFPKCIKACRLNKHPSMNYYCSNSEDIRECNDYEPVGSVVRPECKTNYYYSGVLTYMHCNEDGWDRQPKCIADCGRVAPRDSLILDGKTGMFGEVPWHAAVYRTSTSPYQQICGGSVVTTTVIISAARCFWTSDNKQSPASEFSVAVGKVYQPWDHPDDSFAQKSEVSKITIPTRFQGAAANFQDDIALVTVKTPFQYSIYVRPVCLDFDYDFDHLQLTEGRLGNVAGWGLTEEKGSTNSILQVVDIPFADASVCISQIPSEFVKFITSDKICAGYNNGTAVCRGDNGSGLSFPDVSKGVERYYLRGVVSSASWSSAVGNCSTHTYTTFTHIHKHEHFIKEIVKVE